MRRAFVNERETFINQVIVIIPFETPPLLPHNKTGVTPSTLFVQVHLSPPRKKGALLRTRQSGEPSQALRNVTATIARGGIIWENRAVRQITDRPVINQSPPTSHKLTQSSIAQYTIHFPLSCETRHRQQVYRLLYLARRVCGGGPMAADVSLPVQDKSLTTQQAPPKTTTT